MVFLWFSMADFLAIPWEEFSAKHRKASRPGRVSKVNNRSARLTRPVDDTSRPQLETDYHSNVIIMIMIR